MTTPYNRSHGVDLHTDAPGEVDWDLEAEEYHLHGSQSPTEACYINRLRLGKQGAIG